MVPKMCVHQIISLPRLLWTTYKYLVSHHGVGISPRIRDTHDSDPRNPKPKRTIIIPKSCGHRSSLVINFNTGMATAFSDQALQSLYRAASLSYCPFIELHRWAICITKTLVVISPFRHHCGVSASCSTLTIRPKVLRTHLRVWWTITAQQGTRGELHENVTWCV